MKSLNLTGKITLSFLAITTIMLFLLRSQLSSLIFLIIFIPFLVCVIIKFSKRDNLVSFKFNLVDISLVSIFIWEVINIYFSDNQYYAIINSINILSVILIYFFYRSFLNNQFANKILIKLITLLAFYFCLKFLIETIQFFYSARDYGFELNEMLQLRFLIAPENILNNDWVAMLLCFLPVTIYNYYIFNNKLKFIGLVAIYLNILAIIFTFSRAGFLSLSIFSLLLLLGYKFIVKKFNKKIIYTLLLLFILCVVPLYFVNNIFISMFETDKNSSQYLSAKGRYEQFNTLKKQELTLNGNNFFAFQNFEDSNLRNSTFSARTNNILIQIIYEKGIIGLLLFILLLCAVFRTSFLKIIKYKDRDTRIINVIFLSFLISILIREMFFSTIINFDLTLFLMTISLIVFTYEESYQ